ncbi:hypothetical protein ABPG74_010147, partial [Tetrahymena malaccensis]
FLYQNQCDSACPDGFFKDASNNKCSQCASSCKTCTSANSCSSCQPPLINYNNTCIQTCPSGFYSQTLQNQCQPCFSTCSSCSGPSATECLGCPQGTFLKGSTCVNKCGDGYYLSQDKCSQCHPSCKNCQGPNQDQCIECPDILFKYNSKCLSDCPQGTYQEQQSQKQCFSCSSSCSTGCNGPSEKNCNNLKPQNQIIVYILSAKTVIWVISSIVGIIQDQKNKKSQILTVVPKNTIEKKFDFDSNDSPITRKRKKVFADIYTQNITMNDSPIQSTKQNGLNDNYQLPSFAQNEGLQPQFDSQQTQLAGVKDGNTKSEVNLQTQTEKSPKNSYNRRRPRKSQFILNINQKSMNALSSQVNIIDSSPITTKRNQDQSVVTSAVSPFSQSSRNLDKPGKSENQKYLANEKLKYSFLGNEWIELFAFYDPYVKRACRITLIYLKYHMFFFICEYFKFSPEYYLSVCLASGLSMKFIIEKILYLMTKYTNFGNLLSMILFLGALGADFWYWFIPKIQSQNSAFQINFGYHQNVITEYLVSQDFTDPNQSSATGWSQNSIASCNPSSSFVDWVGNQKLNGIFQQNSQSSVTIELLPQSPSDKLNKGFGFKNYYLYVDTCDYSCATYGKYLLNGLFNKYFGQSEITGLGLTVSNFKGLMSSFGQSGALTTNCGTNHLLGGFWLSGSGSSISRSWTGLAPHWSIRIGFTVWQIDQWQNENFIVSVDGQNKKTIQFSENSGSNNICGYGSYKDLNSQQVVNITHSSSTFNLKFYTDLAQDVMTESFGLSNLYVLVDFCSSNCLSCNASGSTFCLSCSLPLYLQTSSSSSSTCVLSCNSNQYPDNTLQKCINCNSSCTTCSGNCHPTCKTCSGTASNNCLTCSGNLYLSTSGNMCISQCSTHEFKNSANNKCTPCDSSCFNCSGSLPYNYNSVATCSNCNSSCTSCSGGAQNNCMSCSGSLFLDLNTNTCVSNCPLSYYQNQVNNQCSKCNSSCATCNGGSINNCLSCNLPLLFESSSNTCTSSCLNGQYMDMSSGTCMSCDLTCSTCTDGGVNGCSSCALPLYYEVSKCVSNCDQNQYKDNATAQCLSCDSSCQTCSGALNTQCLSCSSNLYLDQNTCKSNCPDGYYQNTQNNTCSKCDASCSTCSGSSPTNCLKCVLPRYFQQATNTCEENCNKSQYLDSTDATCKSCHSSCQSCNGPQNNQCQSCSGSTFLYQNQCFNACPDGYFQDKSNNMCTQCKSPCKTCNSLNNCLSCEPPLISYNNSCVQTCPSGFYSQASSNSCQPCFSSCQRCTGPSADECLGCPQGLYFKELACVDKCGDGYFLNQDKCSQCHPSCKNCLGAGSDSCTECPDILAKYDSKCLSECPKGTYLLQSTSKECLQCSNSCQSDCVGPSDKDCTNLRPRKQIIVYILFSKTVIWVISSLVGMIQDQKNKKAQNLTVVPSNFIENQFNFNNDSPIRKKLKKVPSDVNEALKDQNEDQKKQFGINEKEQLPTFNQNEKFQAQFDNQLDMQAENNDLNGKSEVNLQNQEEQSPKWQYRRRPRKTQFILKANIMKQSQLSMNALSSQVNIIDQSPITTEFLVSQDFIDPNQNSADGWSQNSIASCNQASQFVDWAGKQALNGFGFKNYYLYVDTCDYSCATCNGPTSNQCLTCPLNSIKNGSSCTCASGYIQHQYSCVISCPLGFLQSNTINQCVSDFSINCSNFNSSTQLCQQCNLNYFLYQGQCVSSCPQTSSLVSNQCIDFSTSLINGQYILNGLFSKYFGQSEITGLGLVVSNFKGLMSSFGQSGALTTNCGSNHLLGGFWLSGINSSISRSWTGLAPHWSIRIGFTVWKIDYWDNRNFFVQVDGQNKKTIQFSESSGKINICGFGSYNDLNSQQVVNITHSSSNLQLKFYTDLNSDVMTQSFALSNLYVLVDFCSSNCLTCNASGCLTCQVSYFLYKSACVQVCPSNTYLSNPSTCLDCNSNCKTCSSSSTFCTSCDSPNYLIQSSGSCVSTCPASNWVRLRGMNGCSSCVLPLYYQASSSSCVESCLPNQYQDKTTAICSSCDSSCASCSGPSKNECLSCSGSLYFDSTTQKCTSICPDSYYAEYLYQNQCKSQCPDGYYQDSSNNQCTKCNQKCKTCTSMNSCSSCQSLLIFHNNDCVQTCPSGFYSSLSSQKCEPCFSKCQSCNGPSAKECLSCPQGSFLQDFNCVQQCADGYYQNQDKCSQCHPQCKTCTGSSEDQCIQCSDLMFKYNSKCLSKCPKGTYYQQASQKECFTCNSSCQSECDGPSEKDCTSLKPQNQIIVYILIAKTLIFVISSIFGLIQDHKNKKSQILTILPSSLTKIQIDSDDNSSPIKRNSNSVNPDSQAQNIVNKDSLVNKQYDQVVYKDQLPSFNQNEGFEAAFESQQMQPSANNIENIKSEVNLQNEIEKITKSHNRRIPRKAQFILRANRNKQSQLSMNAISSQVSIMDQSPINTKRQLHDQIATTSNLSSQIQPTQNFNQQENKQNHKYQYNQKLKYSILGNEWVDLFAFYDPNVKRFCRVTLIYLKYHMFFFICEHFKFSPVYYISLCLFAGLCMKLVIEKILFLTTKYTRFGNLFFMILFFGGLGAELCCWFIPKIQQANYSIDREYLVSQEFTNPSQATANGWSIPNSIGSCDVTSFVDWSGNQNYNGILKLNLQQKTYNNLPPHWSLSIRFDLVLYGPIDNNLGDYIQINLDGVQDTISKGPFDGLNICSNLLFNWNDELILYFKNITHSSSSVTVQFIPQEGILNQAWKGFLFKNYYLYLDTCHYSCATCSGPTNGQYLLNGLFNGYFGQSEISGMGLTVSNFKGLKSYFGQSGALTTNCGTNHLLGGFWLSGSGASVTRIWTGLAPHWSIRIGFSIWKIDQWNNENFYLAIDSAVKQTFQFNSNSGSSNICGYGNYKDLNQPALVNFTHSSSQLNITFYSNLVSNVQIESFGISNLYVLIDFCSQNCISCNAQGCLVCQSSYFLYNNICLSSCPSNTYQNTSSSCKDCDSSCKTCSSSCNI